MKKTVFYGLWGVVTFLQLALAAGALLLHHLADTRGGVNHHVAYRKRYYNKVFFTDGTLFALKLLLVAMAILLLWLLIRSLSKQDYIKTILASLTLLGSGVLLFELSAPSFKKLPIFPYAVLITAVIFALECLLLCLSFCIAQRRKVRYNRKETTF